MQSVVETIKSFHIGVARSKALTLFYVPIFSKETVSERYLISLHISSFFSFCFLHFAVTSVGFPGHNFVSFHHSLTYGLLLPPRYISVAPFLFLFSFSASVLL
jgi:hypothetical protein